MAILMLFIIMIIFEIFILIFIIGIIIIIYFIIMIIIIINIIIISSIMIVFIIMIIFYTKASQKKMKGFLPKHMACDAISKVNFLQWLKGKRTIQLQGQFRFHLEWHWIQK